jgi:hypothetical protein
MRTAINFDFKLGGERRRCCAKRDHYRKDEPQLAAITPSSVLSIILFAVQRLPPRKP